MRVRVLGAGPAGSTAALFLAEAGVDVELIDRTPFPREKPCGGGLFNPEQYLRDFPYVEDADGTYIYRILFRSGRHSAEHISERPLFKMSIRKEFDHFLLKRAVEKGAAFRVVKEGAEAIPPDEGTGGIVIDARGARRPSDYPACGVCLVHDFETDRDVDTAHVHYGFMGIKGYCWLYPKKGYVNIGVGAYMPQRNIGEVYERFVEFLNAEGTVSIPAKRGGARDSVSETAPASARPGARPSGALLPFAPRRRFYTERSLLAGDAAGFVNPSTGEGIYFAMLSGKLAARAVIEKRAPAWYEGECRGAFGRFLKPVRFGLSTPLLNRVLEKAVQICERDERFSAMIAENFVRFAEHDLTGRFLRGLLF